MAWAACIWGLPWALVAKGAARHRQAAPPCLTRPTHWRPARPIFRAKRVRSFTCTWPGRPPSWSCLITNRHWQNWTVRTVRPRCWRANSLRLSGACPKCWAHRPIFNSAANRRWSSMERKENIREKERVMVVKPMTVDRLEGISRCIFDFSLDLADFVFTELFLQIMTIMMT